MSVYAALGDKLYRFNNINWLEMLIQINGGRKVKYEDYGAVSHTIGYDLATLTPETAGKWMLESTRTDKAAKGAAK